MATLRTLRLTSRARRDLEQHRDHDERPYVRERCSALLKIADGQAPHWVAQHDLLNPRDPDTVYGWLGLSEQEGLADLIVHQHGGPRGRSLRRAGTTTA